MKKIIILIGIFTLTFLGTSCKDNFFDVNKNPNDAVVVPAELILPAALQNSASYVSTNFQFLNLWMGYWNWSGNYSINTSDKNYQFVNTFNNGIWNTQYANLLNNYNGIENKAIDSKQPLLQAMAKTMRVHGFQYVVDTYNNAPYTDALKGTTSILPKYDDAKTIYEDFIVQLDLAMDLFTKGTGSFNPGANDIMFGGDISQWKKFVNTLKLRILLRQSEMVGRDAYIKAQLAKIKSSNVGFLGAGESANVNPGYLKSTGKQSPFWENYGFGINGQPVEANNISRANLYGITFYKQTNDPRLGAFYAPVGGIFDGRFFGDIDVLPNSKTSAIGPGVLKSFDQDAVLLSSHESLFLQAEAAQRGWITGDSRALYQMAITESFKNTNIINATIAANDYYSQTGLKNVSWDATNNDKIALIITQKWASLNALSPFEAWCDYRRLGIPAIPISKDPSTNIKKIPSRLFYPQSEYNYNAENVKGQGTINQFDSKIFWMK